MDDATFAKKRLEYLRGELRAERISYDGLHELQSLAKYIDPSDVELLEPAGVPEGTDPKLQPLSEFVRKYHVALNAARIDKRPDKLMSDTPMCHFKCRITAHLPTRLPRRTAQSGFALYFSQGLAHTEEPSATDVLNCLADDAAGFENARSFEEWASEYGYDADSRKAESVYRTVKRQAMQLQRMLGPDVYKELLCETGRL